MSAPDLGIDLWGTDDLDPRMPEVSGFTLLAQSIARALDTPNGTLIDDDEGEYGFDLVEQLSVPLTADELAAFPDKVAAQIRERDGVHSCTVFPKFVALGERIELSVKLVSIVGTGSFTLAISDVAKTLLDVQLESEAA